MEIHVDIEGSNTYLDPLGGRDEVQVEIYHEEFEVIAANGRTWH